MNGPWRPIGWNNSSDAPLTQRRITARTIDLAITGVLAWLVSEAAVAALSQDRPELRATMVFMLTPVSWTVLAFVSDAVGVGLFGHTLGKRLLAIRVVCSELGDPPGWRRALMRARSQPLVFIATLWVPLLFTRVFWPIVFVSTWLAWVVSHVSLASFARQPDGRGRPDRKAGTMVCSG